MDWDDYEDYEPVNFYKASKDIIDNCCHYMEGLDKKVKGNEELEDLYWKLKDIIVEMDDQFIEVKEAYTENNMHYAEECYVEITELAREFDNVIAKLMDSTISRHYENLEIEPIEVMRKDLSREEFKGYLKGNIIKYILRAPYKGQEDSDYKKAAQYSKWLSEF